MSWVMNVPRTKLGAEFNIVGGRVGEPVIFPRREPGFDAEGSGLAGIYADEPAQLQFVPADETEPDHILAAAVMNDLLRREAA